MNLNFQQLESLFGEARRLPPKERAAFLEKSAPQAPELRAAVLRLLRHHDSGAQALETPVALVLQPTDAEGSESVPASSLLDPTLRLEPGTMIGAFKVVRPIGAGGMGVVYLAEQSEPVRQVALKIIRPELATGELLKRFRFEASVLARLQHPGIGHIYDTGFEEVETPLGRRSLPFIAMEHIDGPDLVTYCKDLSTRQTIELFSQVCGAVEQAHRSGFIHRDLKPGNILVEKGGRPKVLDFGVARAASPDLQVTTIQTQVGQIVGSIPYMSPEQVAGGMHGVDPRTDVFSLGVILYELLAGQLPLDLKDKSLAEASRIITDDDPLELGSVHTRFRGDLSTIVSKALEKDPSRRYDSAAEFARDLERYLAHEPIHAHAPSTWYRLVKFSRRNRGLVSGIAIAAVILVAGTVVSTTLAIRNADLAQLARESQRNAERTTYRTSIIASLAALEVESYSAIAEHLEDAPANLRGWEWFYLDSLVRGDSKVYPTEAFSPVVFDASEIPIAAIESDKQIEIVELDTGTVRTVVPIESPYGFTCVTEDSRRIFAYSRSRGVLDTWVIDPAGVARGRLESSIPIEVSLDNTDVLVGVTPNADGSIVAVDFGPVLESGTGRSLETLEGFAVDVRGETILEWDFRGSFVARGAPWVQLLDARTGDTAREFTFEAPSANGISWSPDGTHLALRERFGITRILDSEWQPVSSIRTNNSPPRIAMQLTDSNTLWEASGSAGVRAFDAANGQVLTSLPTRVPPSRLLLSPDESSLAIVGADALEHRTLPRPSAVLEGHESFVYSVSFSPDGSLLASGSWDGTVRIWDLSTLREMAVLRPPAEQLTTEDRINRGVSFSPDGGSVFAATDRMRGVREWSLATGICSTSWFSDAPDSFPPPVAPAFLRRVTPGEKVWARATGERYARSFDGLHWSEVSWEIGIWRIYSVSGDDDTPQKPIRESPGHAGGATAVAFDRTGQRLATGGRVDERIVVWDTENGEQLLELHGHVGPIFSLSFHPDGTRLASGGRDGFLRLWNLETGELLASLPGHESYVHSVAFSPDGTRIATGSGDGDVRIWDAVSMLVREQEAAEARALEQRVSPSVERLSELHEPQLAAEKIVEQFEKSPSERAAALRVQLKKWARER